MPGAQQRDDRDGEGDEMIPGTKWEFFNFALRLALHYDCLDGKTGLDLRLYIQRRIEFWSWTFSIDSRRLRMDLRQSG